MNITYWLWLWFIVGAWVHIIKRAYLKIHGPDQSINTYGAFFFYYWPVLIFRAACGAALYWLTFDPDVFASLLRLAGWSSLGTIPALFPHVGAVALIAGLASDSLLDFVSTKISWFQDFLPTFTIVRPSMAAPIK